MIMMIMIIEIYLEGNHEECHRSDVLTTVEYVQSIFRKDKT
jgi:hypothetical protein